MTGRIYCGVCSSFHDPKELKYIEIKEEVKGGQAMFCPKGKLIGTVR